MQMSPQVKDCVGWPWFYMLRDYSGVRSQEPE
jgi:hypothetical protein